MKTTRIALCSLGVLAWLGLPLMACSSGGSGGSDTMAPVTSASPAGGTFAEAVEVSLSCTDGDGSGCFATFYTSDGSAPDQASTPYSGPINIAETSVLRFFSVDNAGNEEAARSQEYVIDPDSDDLTAPITTASPEGGTYGRAQAVSLSCDDAMGSGCAMTYFTVDGSDPTANSTQYDGPIAVDADTTLKFFSVDQAGNEEAVRTEDYVIDESVQDIDPPLTTASPVGGSYVDAQSVSLTCDDGPGSGCADTFYTLDGSEPDTDSQIYADALLIDADTTLKFFSVDNEGNAEQVRTEIYQVVGECTPGVDTDADGLNDCDELDGWFMNLDLNGDGDTEDAGEHEVHVSSDPFQADADGDGLNDLQENQRKINPNRADTDQDGLDDWEEINIYFSDADHVDSDGDATGPDHDQLPDAGLFDGAEVEIHHTSPQMADTDGDSFTDLEEIQVSNNPLVADLPRLRVGVITAVDVVLHADVAAGCEISDETMNATLTRDDSRSVVRSSAAFEYTSSMSDTIHAEMNGGIDGIFPHYSGSIANDLTMSSSTSLESNLSFENESARSVTDEYRHYRRQDCFSSQNADGGSITATIRVANVGGAAVYLQNMEVIAMKRDRNNFGRLTTLASVELFANPTSVGNNPVDVAVDIPLSASQAMELLDDPSGLFVYASRYTMTDEAGRDYAFIENETLNRTGMLEIDYGAGRLERYLIATNVERDENNTPVGINLAWALENVLGMVPGVDFDTVISDGLSVLQFLDDADAYGTDLAGYQGWLVMGDGQAFADDPAINFEDIVLHPGETISLSFVHDSDLDGLFDKEEAFYGSDPLVPDTDGDMIGDRDEANSPSRHPVVPEFPAGQRVAHLAARISTAGYTSVQTLVLLANGSLWGLGEVPSLANTPVRFKYVAAGGRSPIYAGIGTDDNLYTWGRNRYGMLGIGEQDNIYQETPVMVGDDCGCWAKVDIGGKHVLAIKTDGTLWGWGANDLSALGVQVDEHCPGSDAYVCTRTPVQISADQWIDIAAGYTHSLGIKADHSLWAWGGNGYGDLGTGDTTVRDTPTRIYDASYAQTGDDTWRKVDAWAHFSLAVLDTGANDNPVQRRDELRTWGRQMFTLYGQYDPDDDTRHYDSWGDTFNTCQLPGHDDCAEGQMCLYWGYPNVGHCHIVRSSVWEPRPLQVYDNAGNPLSPDGAVTSISAGPFGSATWGQITSQTSGNPPVTIYAWNPTQSFTWGLTAHGETGRGPGAQNTCWVVDESMACNRAPKPVVDDDGQPFLFIDGGRGIGNPADTGSLDDPPPVAGELNVWGYNGSGQLGLGLDDGSSVSEPVIVPEFPLP